MVKLISPVILQIRLYCLHGKSKKVLMIMACGFATEVIAMMGVMAYISVAIRNGRIFTSTGNRKELKHLAASQIMDILPQILFLKYSILGFYDFLLFCLAILAGIQRSKDEFRTRPVGQRISLVEALIKGNIVYFFV